MKRDVSSYEKKYVNDVYENITQHFNFTRYRAWPSIEKHIKSLKPGLLIDIGCGNGRNLCLNPDVYDIGTDYCMSLCQIAHEQKKQPILRGNALNLPLKDNLFEHVICIAVIHHFASEEHRVQCLSEIARILVPGGRALVTAWSMKRKNKEYTEQDQLIPWTIRKDFNKDTPVYERYYHLFREDEFSELIAKVPELKIIEHRYEQYNYEVVVEKVINNKE